MVGFLFLDVFNVDSEFYAAFLLRDYLKLCFQRTFKSTLHKFNEHLFTFDFSESQPNPVYIAPVEILLKEFMSVMDANTCVKARLQLLFQALFNVAYPRFQDDKEVTVHAIAMLIIEYVCYCIEHPPYIGQEVCDGVRVRPAVTKICNYLRNYMYYTEYFPTAKDKELYELWCQSPVTGNLCWWVGKMVTVNKNWKDLCDYVNEQMDEFYMGMEVVPIQKEIEFVTRTFCARSAFLKPLFAGNERVTAFLEKNTSPDFTKLAMKLD